MNKLTLSYKPFKILYKILVLPILCILLPADQNYAQGKWTQVVTLSPNYNAGVMVLLTDGRVLAKSNYGGASYGNTWDILTPDENGSYVNGT